MTLNRTLPVPENIVPPSTYPAGSSEWWIERLTRALHARQPRFARLESYYRGTQALAHLATQSWRESEVSGMFPDYLHANHAKLIVNAAGQRLVVLGFRLGGELRADTEAARIWNANGMEAESDKAHTESLVKGECPVLVEPDPRDPSTPIITPQDPANVIVWHAPNDSRIRLAALKTWWDDDARRRLYILYLPDRIEHWQDRDSGQMDRWLYALMGNAPPRWEPRDRRGQPWRVDNPLGEVPVVVLPNDPRLSGAPEGEHEPVLNRMDQYNATLLNMAVTSHELAYPQRWGTGVEPDDGEVAQDAETGEPIAVAPAQAQTGQTRWISVRSPDSKFGQFVAASLEGYTATLSQIRGEIGTDTFTPYHYLLNMPTSVAPSGDAITTLEAPLVDKCRGHSRDKGIAWRRAMYLAFRIANDETRARAMLAGRVLWSDPERHTEAQHVDALSKLAADPIGVPQEAVWELIPTPPEEIARWLAIRDAQPAGVTSAQAETVGALVRAGFDPTEALQQAGVVVSIRHTGLLPVTLQSDRAGAQVVSAALAGEELPAPVLSDVTTPDDATAIEAA